MEPAGSFWQEGAHLSVLRRCGDGVKPLGREGTGSGPGDTMTKTTVGGSQLWQLTQNTQGPVAAA